ncbi:MAG: hypothetical protein ACYTKD_32415, partial [Planctomycetota bacterium]
MGTRPFIAIVTLTVLLPAVAAGQRVASQKRGVGSATSTAVNPCGGTDVVSLVDQTIDASTGLVSASRDPAGVETAFLYDSQGRLVSVCEDRASAWAGNCDDGLLTTYTYDVLGKLTRVCNNFVDGTCGQTRNFVRDGRGFLVHERHPEIGANPGQDLIVYEYDARGNVLKKDLENSTQFDLAYTYDAVGRLIKVHERNGSSPRRPLKEFFFARTNVGNDKRAGKLVMTKRHNWVDVQPPIQTLNPGSLDAIITEAIRYEGLDGRPSSRQTRFNFNGNTFAFEYSQTYDQLGNVASITYPQCLHSQGDCPSAAPARTVTYTYEKGFLTGVPGYATNITYQAGG